MSSPQKMRYNNQNNNPYTGFLRIRRSLRDHHNGSVVDTQQKLSETFASLGYAEQSEIITEAVMTETLRRIGITFDPQDVPRFLALCVNPTTNQVHNYDVCRAIEIVDAQRALVRSNSMNGAESESEKRPISVSMARNSDNNGAPNLNPSTLLQMRSSVASPRARNTTPYEEMPESEGTASSSSDANPISSMYQRIVDSVIQNQKKPERELDIEEILGESYLDNNSSNRFSSNALDVLALYIKGQKLLYTESKTYCEQQLNFLMLPAIFISCVGSIFSFLSSKYQNGDVIIASLNGFNAFLLALISYLKLDAKAQAHKTSAYKFDKLESMCEFNSGKFMFFDTTQLDIMDVVKQIEKEVKEIKETNQFILPETIRYEFNFTYTTNVFMLVKKIQATEIAETNNLANLVRQINADCDTYNGMDPNTQPAKDLKREIDYKIKKQNKCLNTILECREQYFNLDRDFTKEINDHIKKSNRWFIFRLLCCDWLKS